MAAVSRFRVPDDVAALVRGLHPELRRKVRGALDLISVAPDAGKALHGELDGLRSLRVGRFRVVYRVGRRGPVEIVAIGPRDRIYEDTLRFVLRRSTRGDATR